ncbi:hypothetical protein TWF751_010695 [Orbilia oligospora]|nr:hypothetical protein TWF751_010695 [Orbilia oligospora]
MIVMMVVGNDERKVDVIWWMSGGDTRSEQSRTGAKKQNSKAKAKANFEGQLTGRLDKFGKAGDGGGEVDDNRLVRLVRLMRLIDGEVRVAGWWCVYVGGKRKGRREEITGRKRMWAKCGLNAFSRDPAENVQTLLLQLNTSLFAIPRLRSCYYMGWHQYYHWDIPATDILKEMVVQYIPTREHLVSAITLYAALTKLRQPRLGPKSNLYSKSLKMTTCHLRWQLVEGPLGYLKSQIPAELLLNFGSNPIAGSHNALNPPPSIQI